MVVVFYLCLTSEMGLPFVVDLHRICVGITRHARAFFFVCDINTTPPNTGKEDEEAVQAEDSQHVAFKRKAFQQLFSYPWKTQMVVQVSPAG